MKKVKQPTSALVWIVAFGIIGSVAIAQPPSEYTLDSCPTSIATNVPPFYQKYFKCMTITKNGSYYIAFESNGLPPYESWYYSSNHPNYIEWVSQGTGYFLNPNIISPQDIVMTVPINPMPKGITITEALVDGTVGTSTQEYPMSTAGLALNGISLFNPMAAPGDDIWEEIYSFDYYNGHPDAMGTYHNHTISMGPLEVLAYNGLITNTTPGSGEIEMYGIMCDGTVVLGCTELDGSAFNTSDLDAQSGHVHDMVDEDGITQLSNRYHTHMCWASEDHKLTPEIQYYEDCYMEALSANEEDAVPTEFALRQNYPNPFNPSTIIQYELSETNVVTLTIFDILGGEVVTLVDGVQAVGVHRIEWDGKDKNAQPQPAGIYFYRLVSEKKSITKKLVLLR